jgi:predicted DNA binding CopG/RHH family protein
MKNELSKEELNAAESAFADEMYRDRDRLNKKALKMLKAVAATPPTSQITIRLDNGELALAKKQAEVKGLKYQTYIKMLLHEALFRGGPAMSSTRKKITKNGL